MTYHNHWQRPARWSVLACILSLSLTAVSCGEDDLTADPSLSATIYDPADGLLGQRINQFYDRYGSRVLYEFTGDALRFSWTNPKSVWYTPVPTGGERYVERMINFLETDALSSLPEQLVRKYLPYRIFLVDSLCDNTSEYSQWALCDMAEAATHGLILAHVGPSMDDMESWQWDDLKTNITNVIMNSIYATAEVKPTEFFQIGPGASHMVYVVPDETGGLFTDFEYTLYSNGLISANEALLAWMNCYLSWPEDQELGAYITWIISTPFSEMKHICDHFPLVLQRARLVAAFIIGQMQLDPIEMQHGNCPDDPIPAGWFD